MFEKGSDDDELFSMDQLEKDLKKGRGGRRAPWFLGGLLVGIAGTIALPPLLGPYLPDALRGDRELLSGPVLAEERDGDRLLLTIRAEPGALIASFSQRVAEIALLVEPGDTVSIAVPDYEPFVEDPDFEGVRKGGGPPSRPEGSEAGAGPARPDTVAAGTDSAGSGADSAGARPDSAGPAASGETT